MDERAKEQQHVTRTIALIYNEQKVIKEQQQQLTGKMQAELKEVADYQIRGGSNESFYESAVEYRQHEQELLLKYHTAESQVKRLKTLYAMAGNPYFARIDFKEGQENKETLYLGIASLRDKNQETIVIDWRAPIANLYYEGELGPAFYETDHDRYEVELLLKRQFKIQDGQMLSMVDTSEVINDEFLLEILDEASSSQMKNIVSTIQKAQNRIIRNTTSKVMLIEGIAGSGKTSALLQRIAFLLYRNRKWLADEQVLLFSPNHLFSDYISMVLPSLGESTVPTRTFRSFMDQLLPQFTIEKEAEQEDVFLSGNEKHSERLKSSLVLVNASKKYIQAITELGPLFRNLKVNGQTLISTKQMRTWYQETNPNLPLYQRTQLLQTKLLKKVGGLQKDEAKKTWVKDAAEEELQQYFADHPNLTDSEENERKLRNQIKKQIVKRHFRSMVKSIHRFQFINFSKQYLHFLQNVSKKTLAENHVTENQWQKSWEDTRELLKNRLLKQEDAVLFFLLLKGLRPIDLPVQARFIFIDEMQDFPPAQVALLRELYPQANLTLCGDLNQKVFGNETIVGNLSALFPNQEVTRYQLTTSYRSTKEITDFANQFLSKEDAVEMTARKGDLPTLVTGFNKTQCLDYLKNDLQTNEAKAKYWRTAIICRTSQECIALYEALDEKMQQEIQLIVSEEDFMKRRIMIIPAYLAKGLEFDRVYAWQIDDSFKTTQDRLIFYTIATRAMHELTVISHEPLSPFFETADPLTFNKIIL
ncbi:MULTISPECIES: RNA polymerase recycling motor HelD [Enterococcus]|uniref:RNA polymerase recycling motor HelD n=1 Tax=Enterococcus TaxID=1350 RepID=UPI00189E4731|nr:RNA polymerase recycling motor HelD [Enterococcus dispar]MCU7356116.1 AAA family ATPase [Enterococcus dispar]MDT2704832.1 RNA polymerase recycling motor HelD [Enterococcus dispar]WCG33459.1 AAA family ATPase [Enterococcus dispar]